MCKWSLLLGRSERVILDFVAEVQGFLCPHKDPFPMPNSIFFPTKGPLGTYRAPEYNVLHFLRIGQGGHFCLLVGRKNTSLEGDVEILLPDNFRWILFSDFREKKLKMSQRMRYRGGHLVFSDRLRNTNLVEDVEIFLPVKFCWIPFGDFRGEVENASANQRPERPSWFSDRPGKNTNLVEDVRWDLVSCQVSINSLQRFRRRSGRCLHQSETRAAIFFFRTARKTQTW